MFYSQSHGRYNSAIVSVGVKLFCNGGGGTQQFTGGIIRLLELITHEFRCARLVDSYENVRISI